MRSIMLVILLCVFSFAAMGQRSAKMMFRFDYHDFGEIALHEKVSYEFEFKNTGKLPLIIVDIQSNCGCTVPEWSKEPVLPKRTSKIVVTYDAAESGSFVKEVKIISNAKNSPIVLQITGTVLKNE